MHSLDTYKNEIHHRLCSIRDELPCDPSSKIVRIHIRVPDIRSQLKKPFSFFQMPHKDILKIWDHIWNNTCYFEAMSLCLYYYQNQNVQRDEWNTLKKWVNRCTCWEHSDDLSKIYADIVEQHPHWIIPTLQKWNRDKNFWKRRQSVVSLLEYSRKRKKVLSFDTLMSFILPLLNDTEYYVQKGVGWTLREIYNVYPDEMMDFFHTRLFDIDPRAYSAATEKLDTQTKKQFREKRRLYRKER